MMLSDVCMSVAYIVNMHDAHRYWNFNSRSVCKFCEMSITTLGRLRVDPEEDVGNTWIFIHWTSTG